MQIIEVHVGLVREGTLSLSTLAQHLQITIEEVAAAIYRIGEILDRFELNNLSAMGFQRYLLKGLIQEVTPIE